MLRVVKDKSLGSSVLVVVQSENVASRPRFKEVVHLEVILRQDWVGRPTEVTDDTGEMAYRQVELRVTESCVCESAVEKPMLKAKSLRIV
jgi:hypothetical protein